MRVKKIIPLCVLALLSLTVQASTADIIPELKELVTQSQFQQAYDLAQKHSSELEGDAEFDFLYGLSALQIGQFQPALFSFERLSASYPQVQRYRLELARSYFYLDNLDQAESEFQRILASQPPAAVQANIQRFLDAIHSKRRALQSHTQGSLTLASGYDSNFNSATSAESVELFNGALIALLSSEQRHRDSPFIQLRALASHARPLTRLSSWDVHAYFSHRALNSDHQYNLSNAGAQFGLRYLMGAWQLRPSLSASQYWLGGENYQQDFALSSDFYWQAARQWQPFVRLSLNLSDNQINNDTDRLRPQIESGLGFAIGKIAGQMAVSYSQDQKLHDSAVYMRDSLSTNLQLQYRLGPHEWYAQWLWQDLDYQKPLAAFGRRDDRLNQYLLGHRHHLGSAFSLYAQASYQDNLSSVRIYQYQRALAEAGITWAF